MCGDKRGQPVPGIIVSLCLTIITISILKNYYLTLSILFLNLRVLSVHNNPSMTLTRGEIPLQSYRKNKWCNWWISCYFKSLWLFIDSTTNIISYRTLIDHWSTFTGIYLMSRKICVFQYIYFKNKNITRGKHPNSYLNINKNKTNTFEYV